MITSLYDSIEELINERHTMGDVVIQAFVMFTTSITFYALQLLGGFNILIAVSNVLLNILFFLIVYECIQMIKVGYAEYREEYKRENL